MKKLLVIGCCLILILCGCADFMHRKSSEKKLTIVPVSSELFTESEIDDAIGTVRRYFEKNFERCTLTEIRYAGDERCKTLAAEPGAEQAILLLSSFYVPKSGADDALKRDSTYENWQWFLVRTAGGEWNVKTYGYG